MSALTLDVRPDAIAILTIDQPGRKANVLTSDLWNELEAMIAALTARTDLVGLVIASGKPDIFIAGADLTLLVNATPNDPAVRAFIDQGNRVLFALEDLPFPTCAAIDGAALGGGLEVALACGTRVVGTNPKVRLGLPETKLGLIPGWGGVHRLRNIVGRQHAEQMIADGEPRTADQAVHMGLADGPCDSRQLLDVAAKLTLAKRIEANESPAVLEARRMLTEGATLPLRDAITLATDAFMNLVGTSESKRLITEFFASRTR